MSGLGIPDGAGRGLFITGTDTGVGKTVVTAAIASLLVGLRRRVGVYKPVQTGTGAGDYDDLAFVRAVVGDRQFLQTDSAYQLKAALAPSVAAHLENVSIVKDKLLRGYKDLESVTDVMLVEGAGGLLVPIDEDYLMADLARDLGLPIVVVVRPGLGTINHTILTVEAAKRRGLLVSGLVICNFPVTPDIAARTNPEVLVGSATVPLLGVIPHLSDLSVEGFEAGSLVHVVEGALAPPLGGCFSSEEFLAGLN